MWRKCKNKLGKLLLHRTLVYIAISIIPILMPLKSFSQPAEPGIPAGVYFSLATDKLPTVQLPDFDNEVLREKYVNCENCPGDGYGEIIIQKFDFWKYAKHDLVSNGQGRMNVYRILVKSNTAEALHVLFDNFKLVPGEKIYFYSPTDPHRVLGAYTRNNNKPDSSFISNYIKGKEMIIEVNKRGEGINGKLNIGKFIHAYIDYDRNDFERSRDCEINVRCQPWYNDWCNQIRSVVKILKITAEFPHVSLASGVLVNNTLNNFDPLILTAGHVVSGGINPESWIFWFNFQSPSCDPAENGNDLMTVTGCNILASDLHNDPLQCPDIGLLRLNEQVPLQYNAYYSGWNRKTWGDLPDDRNGVCIHHPGGDVKKISRGRIRNPLQPCLEVDWNPNEGITEPSSSGAPLYVSTKQVIAVMAQGPNPPSCNLEENIFDFEFSWIKNSWSTLQPHLSPGNENVVGMDGFDPISACQQNIELNRTFYPGNDWQNKNLITIQAAQTIEIANTAPTIISSSDQGHANLNNNSDYMIRAGNRITIRPGFRINSPEHSPSTGIYTNDYFFGNRNRASFRIAPCRPFTDECGFNHWKKEFPLASSPSTSVYGNAKPLNAKTGILIYPNPAHSFLNIEGVTISGIHITDIAGKVLIDEEYGSVEAKKVINIQGLTPGVYFISVTDSSIQEAKHFKIIKQ